MSAVLSEEVSSRKSAAEARKQRLLSRGAERLTNIVSSFPKDDERFETSKPAEVSIAAPKIQPERGVLAQTSQISAVERNQVRLKRWTNDDNNVMAPENATISGAELQEAAGLQPGSSFDAQAASSIKVLAVAARTALPFQLATAVLFAIWLSRTVEQTDTASSTRVSWQQFPVLWLLAWECLILATVCVYVRHSTSLMQEAASISGGDNILILLIAKLRPQLADMICSGLVYGSVVLSLMDVLAAFVVTIVLCC